MLVSLLLLLEVTFHAEPGLQLPKQGGVNFDTWPVRDVEFPQTLIVLQQPRSNVPRDSCVVLPTGPSAHHPILRGRSPPILARISHMAVRLRKWRMLNIDHIIALEIPQISL